MAEEIDDNDFFQQDFTTASEWEIFNARLEEIFHEWKLSYVLPSDDLKKDELSLCEWTTQSENIYFADVELKVKRYTAKIDKEDEDTEAIVTTQTKCQSFLDLMSKNNDFSILDDKFENIHPLARWYGLRDFVIVSPVKQSICNESQVRILLSSIHIAVFESNCEIPVFIQALEKIQHVYLGVCEFGSVRLSFDIIHLNTAPPTCKYLSGLLDVFKGKIGSKYDDTALVSVRISYLLTKFLTTNYSTNKEFGLIDYSYNSEDYYDDNNQQIFSILPFGVAIDPILELVLYCTWPNVAENVVIDSQTYSDFDPMLAPNWSLRTRFDDTLIHFMTECISECLNSCNDNTAISNFVDKAYNFGGSLTLEGNPFSALTDSNIPTLSSVLLKLSSSSNELSKSRKNGLPINDDDLMQILYYLFPDALEDSPHPYPTIEKEKFDPMKIKTAYPDTLVHRLSTCLAACNSTLGGLKAVAQLWAEFTQEIRYRVERCIQIPGIANEFPDSRTCLLHQKLQMLNICMERRKLRDGGLPFSMDHQNNQSNENSDDEFYDCSDEENDAKITSKTLTNIKPEGRLSRLGEMTLVDSDEPLYVPITQEPVPKTEDQLKNDAEVMLKLGPGSELCAQLMSASLLSDMESFKAANPTGKLEDFIRWYSPRDWIENTEDDCKKGQLSTRMLIPGNTWQVVWETAKPVPARRQKRLFDDTKEAEKVLHILETVTIGRVFQLIIASLFHTAILKIQEEYTSDKDCFSNLQENIDKAIAFCCKLSREDWSDEVKGNSIDKWEKLLMDMSDMESTICQIRSLKKKLFTDKYQANLALEKEEIAIITNLLKGFETQLSGGAKHTVSLQVLEMFTEAKKSQNEQFHEGDQNTTMSLPNSIERQFILRVCGKKGSRNENNPQFLRAILGHNEFRLCGAFSQDTTFL